MPRNAAASDGKRGRFSKRDCRQLYEMLLSAIPSSVLLIDEDWYILSANRNFLEKARRSAEETIGRKLSEVFPETILSEIDLERKIREVFKTNEPVQGERIAYRAPGIPLRIYYYSIIPVVRRGITELMMLLLEDVTEQIQLSKEVHQVESHLASVVESASDIVVSTDPEGRIISWNRAAEAATGYQLADVVNRLLHEFFAPEHQGAAADTFEKLKSLEPPAQPEWNLMSKDGQHVPVAWVCSKMKDETGKVEGIVAVGRDLTERHKLEAQVLQSQRLVALGVMAGGIAHEIRNPLSVSSAAAQFLLQEDTASEFVKECAQKIHAGIQRASLIIENLLRFARPSPLRELERVNLGAVVKDTVALAANGARLHKISLKVTIPDEPIVVLGNACLLQQMIMNFVLNALKAMPRGGVLEITLGRNGEKALLRIRDTGCGVPAESLDKIFDPFYTTSPVGDGVGLGLSLCYSIIKQHFGAIEVESTEHQGSTFTIHLPLS